MAWVAFGLAFVGGVILAATYVTDRVPVWLGLSALAAWLLALVIFVVLAVRRARSDGLTVAASVGQGLRTAGRFIREFMP